MTSPIGIGKNVLKHLQRAVSTPKNFATYSVITPDGETFYLNQPDYIVGVGDIQDGMGLPDVEHKSSRVYGKAGGTLRSIEVSPRIVTIQASLNADCLEGLHTLRRKLWRVLRWNRTLGKPPDPSILRYTINGKSTDLYVHYLSDVVARVGDSNTIQIVQLRLIAYDPMFYDTTETTQNLGLYTDLAVSYIIGKINGVWSAMGNVGTSNVYAIAISPDGDTIYIGGAFINWAGVGACDYIAKYTVSTATWSAVGAGNADGIVYALDIGPDGQLYAGGAFHNVGGIAANHIARYNPITNTWYAIGVGADDVVRCLAAGGYWLYLGGEFANAGGVAAVRLAKCAAYSSNAPVYTQMGGGANGIVYSVDIFPGAYSGYSEYVCVGGAFTTLGATTCNYIASIVPFFDSVTALGPASNPGTNGTVYAVKWEPRRGAVFAGGSFTTAGGITVNRIAKFGAATGITPLGSGLNSTVRALNVDQNGLLYVGGIFTSAGGVDAADYITTWNGTQWGLLDVNLQVGANVYSIGLFENDVYLGFINTGTSRASYSNTAVNIPGDAEVSPTIVITGHCTLNWIENVTTGKRLVFNVELAGGEVVTIDMNGKTIESNWRGNMLPWATMLPMSDFGTFQLVPDPIAPSGNNSILVMLSGIDPSEINDNSNQLSNWEDVTGIDRDNTDYGAIYASIIADGGGFYHVALYMDSARAAADLVGHTASYNGAGAQAIIADNASGLGGTITIDAVVGADADIIVYYPTARIEYTNAYLSVDEAVE